MPEPSRRRSLLASGAAAVLVAALSACGGSGDPASPAPAGTPAPATAPAATTAPATPGSTPVGGDNGIADQEVSEILEAARNALSEAETVQVVGSGGAGDQAVELDLGIKRDEGAAGTIALNGNTVQVIGVGSQVYAKVTPEFFEANGVPAEAARLFEGKWLLLTPEQAAPFENFTDSRKFADGVLNPSGTVTKGERGEVDGVPAIALVSSSGGRLWISTQGEPLPLQIEPAGGATASPTASPASSGSLRFTYDVTVDVAAPPRDQVVDLGQLSGGGAGATTTPSP